MRRQFTVGRLMLLVALFGVGFGVAAWLWRDGLWPLAGTAMAFAALALTPFAAGITLVWLGMACSALLGRAAGALRSPRGGAKARMGDRGIEFLDEV